MKLFLLLNCVELVGVESWGPSPKKLSPNGSRQIAQFACVRHKFDNERSPAVLSIRFRRTDMTCYVCTTFYIRTIRTFPLVRNTENAGPHDIIHRHHRRSKVDGLKWMNHHHQVPLLVFYREQTIQKVPLNSLSKTFWNCEQWRWVGSEFFWFSRPILNRRTEKEWETF